MQTAPFDRSGTSPSEQTSLAAKKASPKRGWRFDTVLAMSLISFWRVRPGLTAYEVDLPLKSGFPAKAEPFAQPGGCVGSALMRPSRRRLRRLLRMTYFLNAIIGLRHPEERPKG